MISGHAIAKPSGMLCNAMATASFRPRLTELIVLIATAMPSGKLCAVRVMAVSSPTRRRRRSDAWRLAAAELLIGLRSGTNMYSPSFLVASTVNTPEMDMSRVCFSPISSTSL